MNWRRKTSAGRTWLLRLLLWTLLSTTGQRATTVCAQQDLDVFSDTPLPALDDSSTDTALPSVEELPPVDPDHVVPRVDPDVDELPEIQPAPRAGSDARSPSSTFHQSLPIDDPALMDADAGADALALDEEGEVIPLETVRERYENGRVKIERGVAQDENDNYINHGPWRMWDEQGNLLAEGTYRNGKRHGAWKRWYQASDAELFSLAPFNLFTGPFLSEATFRDGQLNGQWVITDQAGLKVCQWNFVDGRRHGESIWYYHTGRQMRLIHYVVGQIHGELREWDINGEPVTRVQYQDGRRLEKLEQAYPDGQKKVEGMVLQARLVMKTPDDWAEAKLATYVTQGKDEKHGPWKAWYANKQLRFSGQYEWDKPTGEFTWWHANGQKSLQATYVNGLKQGEWMWWHPNGQKSIQGQYRDDTPFDRWVWWDETGKVAQRVDFTHPGTPIVDSGRVVPDSILLRPPRN